MSEQKFEELNDELLEATEEVDANLEIPKKSNNKQGLIDKIMQVSEKHNIPLEHSQTKLRRMSKKDLTKLLAELIEKMMKKEMARQVGCEGSTDERVIALGALRMVHDICAKGAEEGLNRLLPKYGYEVDGFTDKMRDPTISQQIDQCLAEIAEENDILQYISSPYARLGLAWFGALSMTVRRKQEDKNNPGNKNKHVTFVESRPLRPKNPVQLRSVRGAAHGKEHSSLRPAHPVTHTV